MQATRPFRNLILVFCLFLGLKAEAAFEDNFAEANAIYQKGDYEAAAVKFFSCTRSSPGSAEAHYYLGNCFVHMNRMPDAIKEYQAVIKLAPDSSFAQYSAQAIASFPVSFTKQRQYPLPRQSPQPQTQPLPQSAVDLDESSQRVVKTVNAQADATEKALQAEMDAKVKIIMSEAASRAKVVEQEKQEQVAANQAERRRGYTPDNSSLDGEFQKRIDAINQDARRRAESVTREYSLRIKAIEDSAVNTSTAYSHPGEKGTLRHSPLQSSLFVHNYEIESEPSGNPVPLMGTPGALPPTKK